jgi:hypothetical protein
VYIRCLATLLGLLIFADAKDATGTTFEELMGQSQLVFKGTVTKVNAATLPQIRPTASTIVVKVDEVVHAPPHTLEDYTGKQVTVQLSQPGGVKVGEQFVFFTTSWMFGSSIAVREVGRTEPDITVTRGRAAEAVATAAHNKLQDRMSSGELVVVGRVSNVRPAPEDVRRGRHSEHDPHWWEAAIEIESVLKGQINERRVIILFPSSGDVMWKNAPKFHEGEQGIWFLRREKLGAIPATQAHLTALNPLDFHPIDQLDRIKQLVR